MNVLILGDGAMGKVLYNELIQENFGVTITPQLPADIDGKVDIMIDFSHPENLDAMLKKSESDQTPLVIATTGYTDEEVAKIEAHAKQVPVLYSGNYSLGVILMQRLVREASEVLGEAFDIEIIEKHHQHKIDAPSGTAKMLLEAVNESKDYDVIYGREGMQKRQHKEIAVHTIRGGSIVGEHEVLFAGADEILSIKHEALSKTIFAKGAIHGAKWLMEKGAGLYSMEDVLFGEK